MSVLVTLTTDFGNRDPYVAAMKGVVWGAAPGCCILDLSHEIAPHNILEGALFLASALPYFPRKTIHVAVVDPGVGTSRRPIVVSAEGQMVVCPDNGLLTLYTRQHPLVEARVITNPRFMGEQISPTFHGRDIFAPTAGRLACGAAPAEVGEQIDEIKLLDIPIPIRDENRCIRGQVIHIDRFGNLITNIHRSIVGDAPPQGVRAQEHRFENLRETYGDVASGEPLALFGSFDYLEIAVNQGDAASQLGLARGDMIEVVFPS